MRLPALPTLLTALLPLSPAHSPQSAPPQADYVTLSLAYAHAVAFNTNASQPVTLVRPETLSFPSGDSLLSLSSPPRLRTVPTRIYRPRSAPAFQVARARSRLHDQSTDLPWDEDVVPGPDVEDRETILLLAKMTSNAYTTPQNPDWYPLGERWNSSEPFGWEPDADGFRGHIFVSNDTIPTVVLSIKGTSVPILAPGPSEQKDKLNDNLLFSCCCARVSPAWTTVCDCFTSGWRCDSACLSRALTDDSLFYSLGTNLYNNLTYLYPQANIWIVGHSLGGSIAALLGLTFGVPVVAFEAPPERLASQRLHLPAPPADAHITHIYHTADPIAMGTCNGIPSTCGTAGYALESKCHNGRMIRYNTVEERGWSVDPRKHSIVYVISYLFNEDWTPVRAVPVASREYEEGCVDCYKWEFGDWKNTSSSS